MEQEILSLRRNQLIEIINDLLNSCALHSGFFAYRILGVAYSAEITRFDNLWSFDNDSILYGGYPELAGLGYKISSSESVSREEANKYISGIERLMERPTIVLESLSADDVAILGLADGLLRLSNENFQLDLSRFSEWLTEIINGSSGKTFWTYRLKFLAGDLLDNRGRLRTSLTQINVNSKALEVVLRYVWSDQYDLISPLSWDEYQQLFSELLVNSVDGIDIEKAAIWLRTIDILLKQATKLLLPKTDKEALAINQLTSIKSKLDRNAESQTRRIIWLYFACLAGIVIDLVLLTFRYSWGVIEPWTFFGGLSFILLSVFYFAITARELSLRAFYENELEKNKRRTYRRVGFDSEQYNQIYLNYTA